MNFCGRIDLVIKDDTCESLPLWLLTITKAVAQTSARLIGIEAKRDGDYADRGVMRISLDFYEGVDGIDDGYRAEYAANLENIRLCIDLIRDGEDATEPEMFLN
jgi:hypothetical protein